MWINKLQKRFQYFLNNNKEYPLLAGISAGLYPLLFYYSRNYSLVNSIEQIVFFFLYFLLLPIFLLVGLHLLFSLTYLKKWQKLIIPFLNVAVFLFLLMICLYAGIRVGLVLIILAIASLFAIYFYKHLKKLIVLQLFLAGVSLFALIPVMINNFTVSQSWKIQPDDIAAVTFKKKPNIYLIQPDGYISLSELRKGYYDHHNYDFENLLKGEGFSLYPNFRSNYAATLASNAATFMMKHHYYGMRNSLSEGFHAREAIVSSNTVLDVFKNNGYTTHFISEKPYLLLNQAAIGFNSSNFIQDKIPNIGTGLEGVEDIRTDLKEVINAAHNSPQFYFVQFFNPGHIANSKDKTDGKVKEREKWFESIKVANQNLADLITIIKHKDPEGLIIIMSDHGGFVGLDYLEETYSKTTERDIIYSIFGSLLAIHWPNDEKPSIDTQLKSSVNLFRIIFSYLSEDDSYLLNLQENASFVVIKEQAPEGIYKYINEAGNIVFDKVE